MRFSSPWTIKHYDAWLKAANNDLEVVDRAFDIVELRQGGEPVHPDFVLGVIQGIMGKRKVTDDNR
jgi:hypothetical protein